MMCEWCMQDRPKSKIADTCVECVPYATAPPPDDVSNRNCRTCKKRLSKKYYFNCEDCRSNAFVKDDDSIFIPSSFDLDVLTERVVDLFFEGDSINLEEE